VSRAAGIQETVRRVQHWAMDKQLLRLIERAPGGSLQALRRRVVSGSA